MNIELNQKIHEKTADKNIVDRYQLLKDEIHLNKLEKQISDLTTQIANIPVKVEYPDKVSKEVKKAIDYYNQMYAHIDKAELEKQLGEKQDLLTELEEL